MFDIDNYVFDFLISKTETEKKTNNQTDLLINNYDELMTHRFAFYLLPDDYMMNHSKNTLETTNNRSVNPIFFAIIPHNIL